MVVDVGGVGLLLHCTFKMLYHNRISFFGKESGVLFLKLKNIGFQKVFRAHSRVYTCICQQEGNDVR